MASKHTSSAVVPANADSHGLTVLRNSLHYFKEALNQFRVCHDLCAPRDLPDKDLAKKLERCADDFRVMSIDFAALAQEVASVWCRTCWIFYANIHKMSGSPEKILSTIGTQSKKLADGYERVAAMCAQLATKFTGREPTVRQEIQIQAEEQLEEQQLEEKREKVEKLNEAQATTELDTLREERTEGMGTDAFTMAEKDEQQSIEDQFKKAFENYLDEAIEEKKKAEEEHKQAQMLTQSADNRTKLPKWKKIFQRGAREADSDPEVHEVQRHAKAKLEEAQRKVDVRKDQYEKAKVLASELGTLMVKLGAVELLCGNLQTFWSEQAENYGNLSEIKSLEQLQTEHPDFANEKAHKHAEWLAEEKELLEKYHLKLTVINSSYNFSTKSARDEDPVNPQPSEDVSAP